MNREMEEGVTEHAEEYYNCGYAGIYEPKEKAIMFHCVGRGLRIPPLSKTSFPSFILKEQSKPPLNVRPSHHVLDLMAPAVTAQESNPSKEPTDKPQPSQNVQCSDTHSDSSDFDVYISDEDDAIDECDSYPAKTDFPMQNTNEMPFLLPNVMYKTECSSSGNRLVVSESGIAKNEKDDDLTSDDEIFSNPSFDDDSENDNQEISAPTNNLNQTISCTIIKNSANILNNPGGEKNIYLDENLSASNTVSLGISDTSQTLSITDHQPFVSSDDSNPSEAVCSEKRNADVERCESSSSNASNDPVADLFSSGESKEDVRCANPFRTVNIRGADKNFTIGKTGKFPELSARQIKKPQKKKKEQRRLEILSPGQLNIKNIASLLITKPADASERSVNVETNNKMDSKPQSHRLLVIENLPRDFEASNLENILQPFGEIESISMQQMYDKTNAKVKMTGDLEWVVECINGSDAFGVGEEPLKCYVKIDT